MHDINYLNLFLILFVIYFNKKMVSVPKKRRLVDKEKSWCQSLKIDNFIDLEKKIILISKTRDFIGLKNWR
jgi:hypothetical protein